MLPAAEPHGSVACCYFPRFCPPLDIANVKYDLFQLNVILRKVRREWVAAIQGGVPEWPSDLTYLCQKSASVMGPLAHLNLYFQAQSGGSGEARGRHITGIPSTMCSRSQVRPGKGQSGSSGVQGVHFSPRHPDRIQHFSLSTSWAENLLQSDSRSPNLDFEGFHEGYAALHFQMIWGSLRWDLVGNSIEKKQ